MLPQDRVHVFTLVSLPSEQIAQGSLRTEVVQGKNMTINMYTNDQSSEIPRHNHPQELAAVVLEGTVRVVFDGQEFVLGPGQGYYIPAGVYHGPFYTVSEGPVKYLDILSPPRVVEQYLQQPAAADKK